MRSPLAAPACVQVAVPPVPQRFSYMQTAGAQILSEAKRAQARAQVLAEFALSVFAQLLRRRRLVLGSPTAALAPSDGRQSLPTAFPTLALSLHSPLILAVPPLHDPAHASQHWIIIPVTQLASPASRVRSRVPRGFAPRPTHFPFIFCLGFPPPIPPPQRCAP